MNVLEMPLPAAEIAERSVLGSILLNSECIGKAETLTPDHFTLDSNRKIYRAILELWQDGLVPDTATLIQHLQSRRILESVGGWSYVSELTTNAMPRQVEQHIHILHEKKQLREIISQATKAITRAYNQTDKPADILGELNTASVAISADTRVKDQDIFLGVSKFIRQYHADVEWRVDNVLEMGTNGIMYGASGDGKSPLVRSLAVSLAAGLDWLDLRVKRCRVALVSREDYAGTTSRFIKRLFQGMGIDDQAMLLDEWLYINSRAQTQSLFIDNPSDLRLLINNLKRRHTQFCILDVLNVLHSKDENDNTEMRKVLTAIDHIRDEVGCQVMLLHHVGKAGQATEAIVGAGRGSSAMDGFAEFKWRIRTEDEDMGVRSIRFKVKAGQFQAPFFWKIVDQPNGGVTLERTEWNTKPQQKRMM